MNLMRQIIVVTLLNFRSLPQRAWSSLVIVVGMAVVIGVLLSMLSLTAGMVRAYQGAGDAGRAIVLASGAQFEFGSAIPRSSVTTILNAPGIRKDANGLPLADAEVLVHVPATRIATGLPAIVLLRGFGPQGARLRPELALVSGRMFRPGRREMLAGVGAQGQFADLHVGDRVILPDGPWPIVGIFTTKGDIVEGGLVADTDTVMSATRHTTYNSVIARLETPIEDIGIVEALPPIEQKPCDGGADCVGLGAAWATGIAILGGLFPALRAARLPIVAALRAA